MKLKIMLIICFFLNISCNKLNNKNIPESHPFNSILEKELLKMIEVKKYTFGENSKKICSIIISKEDNCAIGIICGGEQIDSTKISGYTFYQNELIAFYLQEDSCNIQFVDKNKLRKLNDSISGYLHILEKSNKNIEVLMRIYKIINHDSLLLLRESHIPKKYQEL